MASDGDTTPDENPPPSPDISADAGGGAFLSFDDSVIPATFSRSPSPYDPFTPANFSGSPTPEPSSPAADASVSRGRKRAASSSPTHDPSSSPPALVQAASSSGPSSSSSQNPNVDPSASSSRPSGAIIPSSSSSQNPNVDPSASSSRPSGAIIPSTGGASSSSSSAVASAPSGPRMIDDWVFEREFTYKDYVFQNPRNPKDYFDVLSDVTDSRNPGGNGLCRSYSVCDVAQTRMKILEATLPAKRGRFYGHRFGDRLSVTQLIDVDFPWMQDYFKRLVTFGLTSEDQYKVRVSENRDLRGCVKYRFSDFKEYQGLALYPTEEMMEKSFDEVYFGLDHPCIRQISMHGPVLATYAVPTDHDLLTKVPLFRSTSSSSKTFDTPQGKRVVNHCVMIIGYGLALHVPTKDKIPYYCFQDNRGQEKDRSAFGRMPCDRFTWAYAPTHVEQCDLTSYRKSTDAEMRLVTREAAEYAVAHMG